MSASLYYTIPTKEKYIDVDHNVRDAVEAQFGESISKEDLPQLRAMHIATKNEGYTKIINLVEKYELINIMVRY